MSNRPCSDAEAATTSPDCLRSLAQVRAKFVKANSSCSDTDFEIENPGACAPVHAEMCYTGSSAAATTLSMGLLLACILALYMAA